VDNYRMPQGDFTFRVDKPAGVHEADNYRPQGNRNNRNDRRERSPDRDGRPAKRSRGPQDRSFRNANGAQPFRDNRPGRNYGGRPWRPFIAAERDLLKTDHNSSSEVAFFNTAGGVTYRPLDELSDSDEAEMDISGDEAGSAEEPSHKRARLTVEQSTSDNNAPKWSNPDPYTALPPETATQGKKKDVVRLIRKSRVQEKEVRTSLPSESADFISFDTDDSDAADDADDDQEEQRPASSAVSSAAASVPIAQLDLKLPPKPVAPKPVKAPVLLPDPASSALGSRKRTHDDEIKMPHARLKKATKMHAGGGITKEWLADPELESTPWMKVDHSGSANMAVWYV
jgi:non-canonical poly(A) RNA polymerase PAPD5/7